MKRRIEKYKGRVIWFDGKQYRAFLTCIIRDSVEEVRMALDEGRYE